MSKSHVGMGFYVCPVCGCKHGETVLLDRRLQPTLEAENFAGWHLCQPHQELLDKGYVALVGAHPGSGNELHTANRTGKVVHIRRAAFKDMFNAEPPEVMGWCSPEVIAQLEGLAKYVDDTSEVNGTDTPPPTLH